MVFFRLELAGTASLLDNFPDAPNPDAVVIFFFGREQTPLRPMQISPIGRVRAEEIHHLLPWPDFKLDCGVFPNFFARLDCVVQ
jgi:hypothetical protein